MRLPKYSPPQNKEGIDLVRSYLVNHSNETWLKYELLRVGWPALQRRMADDLKAVGRQRAKPNLLRPVSRVDAIK